MKGQTASGARRVAVTDPIAAARRYDYADAFAIDLAAPDAHAPEAWVRAGLGAVPPVVDWVARLLGMHPAADPLDDWQMVASGPKMIHLEQSLPLMHVVYVGRRVEPTRRMVTTLVTYRRPLLARIAWTVIAPGHRWAARRAMVSSLPAPSANPGAEPAVGT